MLHFIFETLWGWWGVAGIAVVVCAAVAYFIPSLRQSMLAIAGSAIWLASAFTKGWAAAKKDEKRKTDAAVAKARKEYDAIDARRDTPADVAERLRRGTF